MAISNTRFEERLARISAHHGQGNAHRARFAGLISLLRPVFKTIQLGIAAMLFAIVIKSAALFAFGDEGYARRVERLAAVMPEISHPVLHLLAPNHVSIWISERANGLKHMFL